MEEIIWISGEISVMDDGILIKPNRVFEEYEKDMKDGLVEKSLTSDNRFNIYRLSRFSQCFILEYITSKSMGYTTMEDWRGSVQDVFKLAYD